MPSAAGPPQHVAVIGAGLVGLCTAWFLQEHGLAVTVLERTAVAAGASAGNAGWITPALVAPLPDPAILREGLRAIAARSTAVHVPMPPDSALAAFLFRFIRNCTPGRRDAALAALGLLSGHALSSFDALAAGGVLAPVIAGQPVIAAYRTPAERAPIVAELVAFGRQHRGGADFDLLDGPAVQHAEPALTGGARAAVRIHGQRYLNPGPFVAALADSVRLRGGEICTGSAVTAVRDDGSGVVVTSGAGQARYDGAVLATGAWLGALARAAGVRMRVQSGRGYSFSVPMRQLPGGPVYLPAQRLACTPMPGGALRVAGVMEFRPPEAAPDRDRIARMADGLGMLLAGADSARRTEEWVGARPCTTDGLPVIGATRSPRIFVAGGHGMWGITLGPATGQLLARSVATGRLAPELAPFDPLRRPRSTIRDTTTHLAGDG
jgi:D-amino-acid dehydrogenase